MYSKLQGSQITVVHGNQLTTNQYRRTVARNGGGLKMCDCTLTNLRHLWGKRREKDQGRLQSTVISDFTIHPHAQFFQALSSSRWQEVHGPKKGFGVWPGRHRLNGPFYLFRAVSERRKCRGILKEGFKSNRKITYERLWNKDWIPGIPLTQRIDDDGVTLELIIEYGSARHKMH